MKRDACDALGKHGLPTQGKAETVFVLGPSQQKNLRPSTMPRNRRISRGRFSKGLFFLERQSLALSADFDAVAGFEFAVQ